MTPELTADSPGEAQKQIPSTAGMTTKVVKGSMWTLAGQIAPLAVSLFTTPFVIRMLGAESYGVLILVGLIPTYLGFADFGMSLASTKFASEAYAEGDREREARIVRTAALIAFCSSLPFAVLLFALSDWIVTLFNVPERLLGEASLALKIASITFVVNFLSGIFNTPQLTRLRMDLNTFVTSGFRILGLIATPVILYLGFGIVGAVTVLLIASVLTLGGHLFVSEGLSRHLLVRGTLSTGRVSSLFDRRSGRQMFKFGAATVVATVATVLLVNTEKGILSVTVSTAALAHYSVAFTLASVMTMFSSAMVQSLIPAFSQLQAPENREHLTSLYSRGVRLSLIWLVPALVFLALFARPFFSIWAGREFAQESTLPFYILLGGIAFNIVAYLPYSTLLAAGKTDLLAKLYWIELVPYALIVWYLASRYGAAGAAAAWSLRVVGDTFIQFVLAKRYAGVAFRTNKAARFSLAACIMIIPVALIFYWDSLSAVVVLTAAICLIVYLWVIYRSALEAEEVSWLLARIARYRS